MNWGRSRNTARCTVPVMMSVAMLVVGSCGRSARSTGPRLNPEAVLVLLNVMDTLAQLHPDIEETTDQYRGMSEAEMEAHLADVRRRNAESPALTAAIDALLESEPYRLYFGRFTNVTPEIMRDLILDLPYRRQSGPGGTGGMLYDLVRKRTEVRSGLNQFLAHADMAQVWTTAAHWAPDGAEVPPRLFLIYDSNAGSFTADGVPFFNLYDLDLAALDSAAGTAALNEAVGVMAHELEHTLAAPYLYRGPRPQSPWQAVWVDRITRGLVSEGVAIHCNPPAGLKKELYEDSMVVRALVARLNDLVAALSTDRMTEEDMRAWYQDNYHDYARQLLSQFLARRYSGDELEAQVRKHAPLRPDIEHALGWWMVSRITGEGQKREPALKLLEDPYALYPMYDEVVGGNHPGLRIKADALRDLARARS